MANHLWILARWLHLRSQYTHHINHFVPEYHISVLFTLVLWVQNKSFYRKPSQAVAASPSVYAVNLLWWYIIKLVVKKKTKNPKQTKKTWHVVSCLQSSCGGNGTVKKIERGTTCWNETGAAACASRCDINFTVWCCSSRQEKHV